MRQARDKRFTMRLSKQEKKWLDKLAESFDGIIKLNPSEYLRYMIRSEARKKGLIRNS